MEIVVWPITNSISGSGQPTGKTSQRHRHLSAVLGLQPLDYDRVFRRRRATRQLLTDELSLSSYRPVTARYYYFYFR